MNKMGSAAKVKLNSFDDLFGTEQPQAGTEQVQEIALSELHLQMMPELMRHVSLTVL